MATGPRDTTKLKGSLDIITTETGDLPEYLINLLSGIGASIFGGITVAIIPIIIRAYNAYKESKKATRPDKISKLAKILDVLDRFFPTWSSLKSLSKNRIFKLSYLWIVIVHITAKLFSGTESAVNYILQKSPDPT